MITGSYWGLRWFNNLIKNKTKAWKDKNFLAGLNLCKGEVTYKAVADVFGHQYVSPFEAIN